MALYSYIKISRNPFKSAVRFLSMILLLSGLTILIWVAYPILSFELLYARKFKTVVSPVSENKNGDNKNSFYEVLASQGEDFTRANVWFPKAAQIALQVKSNSSQYRLSIPKLGINNALVLTGSNDLSQSLIQYTGPSPGNIGNPVIFGHSTLLWFYNPNDYKAIFSKLTDLDIGDPVIVKSDNVNYTYKVFEMFITKPNNLSVLSQPDEEILTLITCVPPGTYLKRFIVKARLERI